MTGQTPDKTGHVRRCPPARMGDQTGQTWTNLFRGCPVVRSSHAAEIYRSHATTTIGITTISASAATANLPLASCAPCLVAKRSDVCSAGSLRTLSLQLDRQPPRIGRKLGNMTLIQRNCGKFVPQWVLLGRSRRGDAEPRHSTPQRNFGNREAGFPNLPQRGRRLGTTD